MLQLKILQMKKLYYNRKNVGIKNYFTEKYRNIKTETKKCFGLIADEGLLLN